MKKTKKLLLSALLFSSIVFTSSCSASTSKTINKREVEINGEVGRKDEAVSKWANSDTYSSGIKFLNEFIDANPVEAEEITYPEFNDTNLEELKDSYYLVSEFVSYLVNGKKIVPDTFSSEPIDLVRMVLDHLMSTKDDVVYLIDTFNLEEFGEDDFKSSLDSMRNIYTVIKETMDDYVGSTSDEEDDIASLFGDIREYLLNYELPETNKDFLVSCLSSVAVISNPEDVVEDYLSIDKKVSSNIYPVEESELTNEVKYANACKVVVFFVDALNRVSTFSKYNFRFAKDLVNNSGPLLYKILDLVEAFFNEDNDNIFILAGEVCEDLNVLIDCIYTSEAMNEIISTMFENYNEVDQNINKFKPFVKAFTYSKSKSQIEDIDEEISEVLTDYESLLYSFRIDDTDFEIKKSAVEALKNEVNEVEEQLVSYFILIILAIALIFSGLMILAILLINKLKNKTKQNNN